MTYTPEGYIYLCECPLENDYKNQLTFTSYEAQESYFNSIVKKSYSDYTYIKKDNMIKVNSTIDEIINCNYLFYKNNSISDKIYYCFITRMEYINTDVTAIYFETDSFQTYWANIQYNPCFIERHHTNNDTTGINLVPEGLETGEYYCNSHVKSDTLDNYNKNMSYIVASTSLPITGEAKETVAPTGIYNGIYTGLTYYRYDSSDPIDLLLEIFANSGKTSAINGIFMAPQWLAPLSGGQFRDVAHSNSPQTFDIQISKQTTLNGYTPKNNKLKCYPYNFLVVSNNIGQNVILHYEKFSTNTANFVIRGVLNPGCSINITPKNYNGNTFSDDNAIGLGKYPICNFQNDMYTNWLTQNSINILGNRITTDDINIGTNVLNTALATITSMSNNNVTGTLSSIGNGFNRVSNSLIEQKQHNMITPTLVGNLNNADVNYASGNNNFHFYKMSVRYEFAKIIDDYFSMYGYKINEIGIPNITGRENWNYVKTINCNFDGDGIPQTDMETIRKMFDNGVTFWHNPSTMYNYNNSNNIV